MRTQPRRRSSGLESGNVRRRSSARKVGDKEPHRRRSERGERPQSLEGNGQLARSGGFHRSLTPLLQLAAMAMLVLSLYLLRRSSMPTQTAGLDSGAILTRTASSGDDEPAQERRALAAVLAGWADQDGASEALSSPFTESWGGTEHACTWTGIQCDKDHRVRSM
jgi:hypothetical protein